MSSKLLGLLAVSFAVFAAAFVPRLTNAHFGDVEFTGWTGPVAEHLARGERPYVDFVLPIPPGSFAILALVQRVTGRALLLQELWLGALIHLLLALLAYRIAAQLTTRLNAVLVASASLVMLVNMYKECAYDHTAQLAAWCSVAAGARALFGPAQGRRRAWVVSGFFAALTLAFKQSTGAGIVAGFGLAHAYLIGVARWSRDPAGVRGGLDAAARFAAGAVLGAVLGLVFLLALGGTVGGYARAVLIDGPALKGGGAKILRDMTNYVTLWPSFPPTLVIGAGLAFAARRIADTSSGFHLGDELDRRGTPIRRGEAALISIAIATAFGGAALLLWRGVVIPPRLAAWLDVFKNVPHFGLAVAVASGLAHLRRARDERDRAGHAINALLIAALTCSFLHNTSAPEFRPFYDNNPIVPLGFALLFVALDRGGMSWLKAAALLAILISLFSSKLARASEARFPARSGTHWAGLYVSERGRTMEQAADRVAALTAPGDTVLVLPEDVAFAARIGRPRPALRGAIAFVDQYPRRLVAGDSAELDRHPPKVIVLHPVDDFYWTQMYRIWNGDSGAERLTRYVISELLPRYTRDSRHDTLWYGQKSQLEIWVRND